MLRRAPRIETTVSSKRVRLCPDTFSLTGLLCVHRIQMGWTMLVLGISSDSFNCTYIAQNFKEVHQCASIDGVLAEHMESLVPPWEGGRNPWNQQGLSPAPHMEGAFQPHTTWNPLDRAMHIATM